MRGEPHAERRRAERETRPGEEDGEPAGAGVGPAQPTQGAGGLGHRVELTT